MTAFISLRKMTLLDFSKNKKAPNDFCRGGLYSEDWEHMPSKYFDEMFVCQCSEPFIEGSFLLALTSPTGVKKTHIMPLGNVKRGMKQKSPSHSIVITPT